MTRQINRKFMMIWWKHWRLTRWYSSLTPYLENYLEPCETLQRKWSKIVQFAESFTRHHIAPQWPICHPRGWNHFPLPCLWLVLIFLAPSTWKLDKTEQRKPEEHCSPVQLFAPFTCRLKKICLLNHSCMPCGISQHTMDGYTRWSQAKASHLLELRRSWRS